MGIMPADRDQKWQRVFRRFGLPDANAERDEKTPNGEQRQPDEPEKRQERKDSPKRR
jgi:hypothetical protein